VNLGVALQKLGDDRGDRREPQRHGHRDPKRARQRGGVPTHVSFQRREVIEHDTQPVVVGLPRSGEADAPGGAMQESGVERGFEGGDVFADRAR